MKILMLTPYLPYPPASGGQIRSYNLLKQLYKKHEITLFCYIREDKEKSWIPELEKYCKKVKVFKRRKAWHPFNILLSGFTPYPFLVSIYLSQTFRKAVSQELENEKYDLIHAETFYVMTNIPKTSLPIILVEQTIEYLVYKHFVNGVKWPGLKNLLNLDVEKLKFWERRFWKRAERVVAVSKTDREEMLRLEPTIDVDLVPNGVDLDFFEPKKSWSNKDKRILFTSNFKWLQNVEAAEILIKDIYPKVKEKIPEAKAWIVGQHTPNAITSLASKDVIIDSLDVGDLKSTQRAYNKASVFVAPLRGPGGTRLKNLAAMASKLPMVTTSIGAEGIGIINEESALVRDNPSDLAEGVVTLLQNPEKAKKLAECARKLVVEEYSWEQMAKKLDAVYELAAKR
ncbi:MAG: hypothetical protein A3D24_02025 [Candidatus Blackburnbacteria bacterium RIFCSPHIGHO2_02_FULL_39_13]|nr:MAG: hypothetical protein UT38_C0001G0033 [Microgenomates group bacterium GW2011_GWA2_39_19]OGY06934.1 MAG: hypothetical protein A2694_04095 [Candidatus Blackburnbacteria bacterium RIFCSPHIGHO2_01_FULL_40_17]OGY09176.1 MAG: hypothetical protein A3D24_02025 [Candidatus Blackburnbacteria bacterium RIFCSPHIGHO2_02_FULL_39_13]HBL52239.1 hypothetical protein [Candidatus Blackburnbacteria bacterium]